MLAELDKIDISTQSRDKIKLVITDVGNLEAETRDELFKKKITAYANYIKSPKFKSDFEIAGRAVVIQLVSPIAPSTKMQSVMRSVMKLPQQDPRFGGINLVVNFKQRDATMAPDPTASPALAPAAVRTSNTPKNNAVPMNRMSANGGVTRSASGDSSGNGSSGNTDALTKGPSLIFILVAAADGKIDKKEVKAYIQTLAAAEDFGRRCPVLGKALEPDVAINGLNHYMERIGKDQQFDPIAELKILSDAADSSLSADHCEAYKMGLLFIGKHIAEASGGFLGLFGSKISKDERMALGAIAHTLNIAKYIDE